MGFKSISFLLLAITIIILITLNLDNEDKNIIKNEQNIIKVKEDKNSNQNIKIEYITSKSKQNISKEKQIDNENEYILDKFFSQNKLFQINLVSEEKFNLSDKREIIKGTIISDNKEDTFTFKINEYMKSISNKLILEVKENNKNYRGNAYRLQDMQLNIIYSLELNLIDDYVDLNLIEIGNKPKKINIENFVFKINDKLKEIEPKKITFDLLNKNSDIKTVEVKDGNFKFNAINKHSFDKSDK